MNIDNYRDCILAKGVPTGNLSAVYDFTGGSGNSVYNSLHSPDGHQISGTMLSERNPAIVVRNNVPLAETLTGNLSGTELYRVGKDNPNTDFALILDYSNNFCNVSGRTGQILVSSNADGTGASGFALGTNQSNRLFLEYYSGTTRRSFSVDEELSHQNTVFLNIYNNEQATFGFYDYETNKMVTTSIATPGYSHSNSLYLGGLYNYTGTTYTGLEGVNREFVLFNDSLDSSDLIKDCIECMHFTGFTSTVTTTLFDQVKATGFNYSTQNVSGTIGTAYISVTVPHPEGGTTEIIVPSGVSGVVDIIDNITPLTGLDGSGQSIVSGRTFNYDTSTGGKASYGLKTLAFAFDLVSGDLVEAYHFNEPNPYYNLPVVDFTLDKSGFTNALLYHNGLLNVEAWDFNIGDENVFTGAAIQGYDPSDAFTYNLTDDDVVITEFSGLWSRSRILLNSGDVAASGGGTSFYYPPNSQYHEEASTNYIWITGISGTILTGYDLFLNGQKLIEGYDYHTGLTGSDPALILSGADMPDFTADVLRTGSGNVSGWPNDPPAGITNVDSSLLVFVQKPSSFNRSVTHFTGTANSVEITGYSEQVWVNGVKQISDRDYLKTYPCSPTSGNESFNDDLFLFYNNLTSYFNIE